MIHKRLWRCVEFAGQHSIDRYSTWTWCFAYFQFKLLFCSVFVCVCMYVFVSLCVCVCDLLLSVFFLGCQLSGNEKVTWSKLDFNEDSSLPAKSLGMKLADWTHWSLRVPALDPWAPLLKTWQPVRSLSFLLPSRWRWRLALSVRCWTLPRLSETQGRLTSCPWH